MGILHYILILYPVINLCEAWLEETVIELKNPYLNTYHRLNRVEHFRSAVFACLVAVVFVAIALTLQLYWLIPAIAVNRRLVFDYGLKKFRNREFDRYEGDGFFDSIGRRLFGTEGARKEFLVLLLITITSIYLSYGRL
jgi:hypothetical protein